MGRTWYESFVRHARSKNNEEWTEYRDNLVTLLTVLKLEGRDDNGWVSGVMESLKNADEYRRDYCQNGTDAPAG